MYSPQAVIGHRVNKEMISVAYVKKRASRLGRGRPHWKGLEPVTLFKKHPNIWRLLMIVSLMKASLYYLRTLLSISLDRRVERQYYAIRKIAYYMESLRLAGLKRRNK
jgi:hypothetical protein